MNPRHLIGKHKARVFTSTLGIGKNDAEMLKEEIIKEMEHTEIEWAHEDQFGKRFSADLAIHLNNRNARIRTIWIIEVNSKIPQHVTCYVIT